VPATSYLDVDRGHYPPTVLYFLALRRSFLWRFVHVPRLHGADQDDNTAMSHDVVSFMSHPVIQRDEITAAAISDHAANAKLPPAGGNGGLLKAITLMHN